MPNASAAIRSIRQMATAFCLIAFPHAAKLRKPTKY